MKAVAGRLLLPVLLMAGAASAEQAASGAARYSDKVLFESRCALCHQLPEPGALKSGQWQRVIVTMQKRIRQRGMVPLTEDEQAQILAYLSARSKDGKNRPSHED